MQKINELEPWLASLIKAQSKQLATYILMWNKPIQSAQKPSQGPHLGGGNHDSLQENKKL